MSVQEFWQLPKFKKMTSVTTSYISTACNRTPLCADWNSDYIIAFGACNSVCLFNTKYDGSSKITDTLIKHTGRVNCVRWIPTSLNGENKGSIISGSTDCSAIIWTKNTDSYIPTSILLGHKSPVNVVDAICVNTSENISIVYAVTGSVDSTVKIWRKEQNQAEFACLQELNLGTGLCLALKLAVLPGTNDVILACAFDDDKVYLFIENDSNPNERQFAKVQTLAGHEDWVRGLDFITIDTKLLLASCSQDTYVRIWSIEPFCEPSAVESEEIRIEKKKFLVGGTEWAVSLETVLAGHEGWVYGVHWNYQVESKKLRLLSSSLDKTLIIWEPEISDGQEGAWMEKVRVGEVGGNGLGFYGGKLGADGESVMGHGYMGSFHLWKYTKESDDWQPGIVCGGHFNEIVDMGWEPEGQFIVTVSTDQTTRIHAPWLRENKSVTWHELARPQVHGYDMSCLAILSRYRFASGAEEKVIRTFDAPQNFVSNFYKITEGSDEHADIVAAMPEGAAVPSLGLSNKAVYMSDHQPVDRNERHIKDQYPENYFVPVDLHEPPTEETLMQNTLWPEVNKLYGHGYEVYSMAATKDGKLLASACKATTLQHAAIILWDTSLWAQIQSLPSHSLTVTQLSFSPDGLSLLSVSRDRRWSVFRRDSTEHNQFSLIATTDKSNGIHTRIIWSCAWTHDSKIFSTSSREGKIVAWHETDHPSGTSLGSFSVAAPVLELKSQSVTASSFAPVQLEDKYLLAAGTETGQIVLYTLQKSDNEKEWNLLLTIDEAHHLTITRLAFRPLVGEAGHKQSNKNVLQLASASSDYSLKIFSINYK